MINVIKTLFKETVYTIIDYDKKYYLVEVGTEEETEIYAINKKTMEVRNYSVAADYQAFFDALYKRTIYRYDGLKELVDIPDDSEFFFRPSSLESREIDKKKTTPIKQWFDNLREAYQAKEEKDRRDRFFTRIGKIMVISYGILCIAIISTFLLHIV